MDGDGQHRATPPSGDSAASRDGADGAAAFRIAGWTVVPQAHELARPGETVRIEPRPMEVLVYLADRAGEAVSREDLMEAVWPGVFVTEHALNRCISQLRKLFDDDPREPRVIETIPKSGYRLIVPVERLGNGVPMPVEALDVRVTAPPVRTPEARRPTRWGRVLAVVLCLVALTALAALVVRRPAVPTTRPLTAEPGTEGQAAWSPDGLRLAYVGQSETGGRRIYVRAVGSDAPVPLTEGPRDFAPTWSPDGVRVAFVRCGDGRCDLYAVDALGGEPRRLAAGPLQPHGIDWSPSGLAIAYAVSDTLGGPGGIAVLDLGTGARRRLTRPPEGLRDQAPRFSPDGAWLLFARSGVAGGDLYRVPARGGEARRLTTDTRPLAGHTWAADGRSILFSSARTGVYALWRIPAGGGSPRPATGPAVRDPGGPAIAPAGGRMVVGDWAFEINLWRSVDGGPPERVVASTLWDKQPALSPDGARLAFVSNRTGPPELWAARADGGGLLRLTDFGGPAVGHPRFSPDGRVLAFEAYAGDNHDVWLVEAEGGRPRRLTTSDGEDVLPRWSRDGRHLYFGSDRGGRWQVWRVPIEGGTPEAVADGIAAEETADGALLVARRDEGGLWRVEDGEARRLTAGPAEGDWASWMRTERGLLYLDRPGGRLVLAAPRTGLGTPLDLDLGALMENEGTFTASADGRTVVWARIDRVEADLLLVEPFE